MKLRKDNYVEKNDRSHQIDRTIYTAIALNERNTGIFVGAITVPKGKIGKKCRILIQWL